MAAQQSHLCLTDFSTFPECPRTSDPHSLVLYLVAPERVTCINTSIFGFLTRSYARIVPYWCSESCCLWYHCQCG